MGRVEGTLVAVTVILLAAWGISRLVFSRPSLCDFVWRTALILVALSPGVVTGRAVLVNWQWQLPVWPAIVLPSSDTQTISRLTPEQPTPVPVANRTDGAGRLPPRTSIETPPAGSREEIVDAFTITVAPAVTASREFVSHETPQPITVSPTPRWSWMSMVAAIWLAGTVLHLMMIGVSVGNGFRLRRTAKLVTDADCLALNHECADRVGLRSRPRLSANPALAGPVVIGIFRPQIAIPPSLLSADVRHDLRAVLLHECGHLKRFDLVFDVLLRLVLAVFWPHPLVYVLASEMRRLREEMCDNFVLTQESALQYAETLLRVAVGKRLNEAFLLGIGVIPKAHRLEQRVASLLSSERRVETSVPQRNRLFVVSGVSGLLVLSLMIRLTSLAAAPPSSTEVPADVLTIVDDENAKPKPASAPAATEDSVNQALEKALAVANANPVEIVFRVLDTQDKPVAGARVLPSFVSDFRGASWGNDNVVWQTVESDAEGFVRFRLPSEVVKQAILLRGLNGRANAGSSPWGYESNRIPEGFPKSLLQLGIRQLYLKVDHPDHPLWSNFLELRQDAQLHLADSYTLVVRGWRVGETELATRVVPWLAGSYSTDWTEEAGVVTYRRVNLTDEGSRPFLQLIQFPEQGTTWFSDVIDLKHLAGNPISLDLTLKRGVRLEGRLADDVPRPVKNGKIQGKIVPLVGIDSQRTAWSVAAKIAEDGTFVLDSLPPHQTLQLIALCDGWNSRTPSQAEFEEFQASNHFPRGEIGFAGASNLFPQLVRVDETDIHERAVPMVRTASCEITAVDAQNRPVSGVKVQFHPNQMFFHWGATALRSGQDDATRLREQQINGDRDDSDFNHRKYSADTDADGKVTIVDLPCVAPDAPSSYNLATFFATHEKYAAQSSSVLENMPKIMGSPFLGVMLTPGKRTQVTLHMEPQPALQFDVKSELADDELSASPPEHSTELSGRVEDYEGHPLEGVKVLLVDEDCFEIRTDAQGEFHHRFDPEMIEPGEEAVIPLRFVKEGFAPTLRDVRIGSGQMTIQLHRNTWFEGTVHKPDGTPAAHVPVRAFHESYSSSIQSELYLKTETMTNADGRYRLLVEPAEYRIVAGHAAAGVAWVPLNHSGSKAERTKMSIFDNEHRPLDIQLEPGVRFVAELIDRQSGQPISDATLILYDNADLTGSSGKSDETGIVTYPALPSGKLTFQIYSPNHLRWASEQAIPVSNGEQARFVPSNNKLTFELRPGMSPVQIQLESGVEVSGIVLDPQGQPVSNAEVHLAVDSSDTNSKGITDYPHQVNDQGRFRFLLPRSETPTYHLIAQQRQRNNVGIKWASGISRAFALEVGSPVHDLEIRLTNPGTVRGRVVNRQGKPVASMFVQASTVGLREPSNSCPSTISRRDGTFELPNLRPGRYWFHGKSVPIESDAAQVQPQAEVRSNEVSQAGDVLIPVDEAARIE
ncbi:M56 family metallopeptidase [Schlesneria paludicola]|uniref:M56 family metallopeptidase n=1 Tax=Schlesneria paludicola TaxID=360056 RepID=UPI00029B43B9|nr:M56 family metallopeptidase [Schlesneria paludicola]